MKKLLSLLALSLMAVSFAACSIGGETDEDSDLLDGILSDPDSDTEATEDVEDEEEPYIEGPTELPDLDE